MDGATLISHTVVCIIVILCNLLELTKGIMINN